MFLVLLFPFRFFLGETLEIGDLVASFFLAPTTDPSLDSTDTVDLGELFVDLGELFVLGSAFKDGSVTTETVDVGALFLLLICWSTLVSATSKVH